jgi:phage baseplate assembly protein W
MDSDYGVDISATSGLDPNFTLVSGTRVVCEALFRRLTTPRGELFYAPSYGKDVREFLNGRVDQRRLDAARASIEAECRKDDRVDTVKAALAFDPRTEKLRIRIEGTTAAGPFTLTMSVTAFAATIEVAPLEVAAPAAAAATTEPNTTIIYAEGGLY